MHGPRAQVDRDLYKQYMQAEVRDYPNLTIIEDGAHVLSFFIIIIVGIRNGYR